MACGGQGGQLPDDPQAYKLTAERQGGGRVFHVNISLGVGYGSESPPVRNPSGPRCAQR